ncbi:MAG TPA: tetratricopeptide repeat protein, partial [Terriglobales bacterium]|nr:tetratricopeptide repeat protein [Terriglobales bacterium]
HQLGDRSSEGVALVNLGDIATRRGHWLEARQSYDSALAIFHAIGDQSSPAYALIGLGEIYMAQEQWEEARQQFTSALQLRQQAGEEANATQTRLQLAELDFARGKPAAAVQTEVQPLLDQFRQRQDREGELDAAVLLTRLLLAQRKLADAQKTIQAAEIVLQKTHDLSKRVHLELAAAEVESAVGNSRGAIRQLRATVAQTAKLGLLGLELEAREALGRVEVSSDDNTAGRRELASVEREARSKGFQLIASRAAREIAGQQRQ